MNDLKRRQALAKGAAILAVSVLGVLGMKANAEMRRSDGKKGIAAVVSSVDKEGICATCCFWGACAAHQMIKRLSIVNP